MRTSIAEEDFAALQCFARDISLVLRSSVRFLSFFHIRRVLLPFFLAPKPFLVQVRAPLDLEQTSLARNTS